MKKKKEKEERNPCYYETAILRNGRDVFVFSQPLGNPYDGGIIR